MSLLNRLHQSRCEHKRLELHTITFNTPTTTTTYREHEIRCTDCGKVVLENCFIDAVSYLLREVKP